MNESAIDRSPARLSSGFAVVAALVAVLPASYAGLALVVAVLGFLFLLVGLSRASRRVASLGAVVLLAGVLLAGTEGAPALLLLVGVTGTVLAWDGARTAIGVGRQLGSAADTRRLEVVHAGTSTAVGGVTAGVGYGIFRVAAGGQPFVALVFLLLAVVLLAAALR